MIRASYNQFYSENANRERTGRCPIHPNETLKDEATPGGISPSSLCGACQPIIVVDVVRELYIRAEDHDGGWR